MSWKIARDTFSGTYHEAQALFGKRIKVGVGVHGLPHAPAARPGAPAPKKVSVGKNEEGFVGGVPEQDWQKLILVFPLGNRCPATLDELMKQDNQTMLVDWPTFQVNFALEDAGSRSPRAASKLAP